MQVPDSTFYISFINKTERIIVCSKSENGVITQVWDCWSGMLTFEGFCSYLSIGCPFLLLDEHFIQVTEDNELQVFSLYPKLSTFNIVPLNKSHEWETTDKNLRLSCATEQYLKQSLCWGYIHDVERDVLVSKFLIEPWHDFTESKDIVFAKWLDNKGNRFLVAGTDSIQIYFTKIKTRGTRRRFLRIELQYMWTVPLTQDASISSVSVGACNPSNTNREENIMIKVLQIQLSNGLSITLKLPEENELISYQIISDACISIHYLYLQFPEESVYFSRLAVRDQLRRLISSHVPLCPSAFNKISLGDGKYIYPVGDFINLGWDDIVKSIFEHDRYIPIFHNEGQTESALSLLVEFQKSELVNDLAEVKFTCYKFFLKFLCKFR